LNSRFTWRFKIDNYTPAQLAKIYEKKVHDCGWQLREPVRLPWFEENMCYFKCFGRDMETLLSRVKIVHGRRVFCNPREKRQLTHSDLEKGMELFTSNEEVKQRKEDRPHALVSMYL
jgi:hypothetical protein